jgi:hypothetical protein
MRFGVVLVVLVACGGNCPQIAARRQALGEHRATTARPHAQVRVPFARANELLAGLLRAEPVRVPLAIPALGLVTARELTAVARAVELHPAPPERLGFAIQVELADGDQPITTLALDVEVAPRVVDGALTAGFGPDNLRAVRPALDGEAGRALGDAVARWLPSGIPRAASDLVAQRLARYLTGEAYPLLRTTLLRRLGELTTLRLRLPELPLARVAVRSELRALVVDLTTTLPVRTGLADHRADDAELAVRVSGSTAAELANWAIAHGQLPAHYTRDLDPTPDGAYQPVFDYLAGARRPARLHIFQDRGGCSYFGVGLRFELAVVDGKLVVQTRDRLVEDVDASAPLEAGLWLKQLIQGPIDRTYQAAASLELGAGGHRWRTTVRQAAVDGDDLAFELAVLLLHGGAPR